MGDAVSCTKREKDEVPLDEDSPFPPKPTQRPKGSSASTSEAVPSNAAQSSGPSDPYRTARAESSKCDLKVIWESFRGQTVAPPSLKLIIGDYEEVQQYRRKKCFKKKDTGLPKGQDIYLYWHDGGYGKRAWWFGESIDGYSGIAWNEQDFKGGELPTTGWKVSRSFLNAPEDAQVVVARPQEVPEEPPTPARATPSCDSCFSCWQGMFSKLPSSASMTPTLSVSDHSAKIGETIDGARTSISASMNALQEHEAVVAVKRRASAAHESLTALDLKGAAADLHGKALDTASKATERGQLVRQQTQEAFDTHVPQIREKVMDLHSKALDNYRETAPKVQEALDKHLPMIKAKSQDLYVKAQGAYTDLGEQHLPELKRKATATAEDLQVYAGGAKDTLATAASCICDCVPASSPHSIRRSSPSQELEKSIHREVEQLRVRPAVDTEDAAEARSRDAKQAEDEMLAAESIGFAQHLAQQAGSSSSAGALSDEDAAARVRAAVEADRISRQESMGFAQHLAQQAIASDPKQADEDRIARQESMGFAQHLAQEAEKQAEAEMDRLTKARLAREANNERLAFEAEANRHSREAAQAAKNLEEEERLLRAAVEAAKVADMARMAEVEREAEAREASKVAQMKRKVEEDKLAEAARRADELCEPQEAARRAEEERFARIAAEVSRRVEEECRTRQVAEAEKLTRDERREEDAIEAASREVAEVAKRVEADRVARLAVEQDKQKQKQIQSLMPMSVPGEFKRRKDVFEVSPHHYGGDSGEDVADELDEQERVAKDVELEAQQELEALKQLYRCSSTESIDSTA